MQETRQKIVELLKEHGQATVEELAESLALTPMAVRHHLNVLQSQNLVAKPFVRRKQQPGRPQQLYSLTAAADQLFPEDYYRLSCYLLDEIKASLGPSGLDEMLDRLASRLVSEAPEPQPAQTPEGRLDQVVLLLTNQGFTAQWKSQDDGYSISVLTCPYRQVARKHTEVCRLDMKIIQSLLNIEPAQTACMANGAECCTYRISHSIDLAANP